MEFGICHAFDYKKGGLIKACHNELRDWVSKLATKAFNPTHVRDDPKIYTGYAVSGGKENLKGSPSQDIGELKGGLLINNLWTQGTDSINVTRVVNNDATSYQSKFPEKCLKTAKKANKKKFINAFLKHRRGKGDTETYCQPPRDELEGTLLTYLQLC